MEKVTITNSIGQSITLEHKPPIVLQHIDGTGETGVNVQSQKSPYQDGATYVDSNLEPRPLMFRVAILEKDVFAVRRTLSKVLNPKLGKGTLKYEYTGGQKEITFVVDSPPTYPSGKSNKGHQFQLCTFTLLCHDPYWYDIYEESEPLLAWIGEFQFPFSFPVRMGRKEDSKVLINDGDVETPITVSFYGPSNNPKLINRTTGEFIKVNRSLAEGDRLEISTAFGNKRVEIVQENGERINVFNWIDLDSTFFQLIPGPNEIEYTADVGTDSANVQVTWKNRYVGI